MKENDEVWAKHPNKRFYKCRILSIKNAVHYCIYFSQDKSFTSDVDPSEIEGFVSSHGNQVHPKIGQKVVLKNNDDYPSRQGEFVGKIAYCIYKVILLYIHSKRKTLLPRNVLFVFQVQFKDNSVFELGRDSIHSSLEAIPKRISYKMK